MNKRVLLIVFLAGILATGSLAGKPHAYGPWNIDLTGTLMLESNSNVFFQEDGGDRDIVWHLIENGKFEYEQLQNKLFSAEIGLNTYIYSKNSEANITETMLHIEAKPVWYGGFFLLSNNYDLVQTYSPIGGLLKSGTNATRIGGGYTGDHLEVSGGLNLLSGTFSPSQYNMLNYKRNSFDIETKYIINSFYWLGGMGSGSLKYSDDIFNDGTFWDIFGGVGKEFTVKSKLEFRMSYYSQKHSKGDRFSGLLYSLIGEREFTSEKGNMKVILDKLITPSSIPGSDFSEVIALHFITTGEFTFQFKGNLDVSYEINKVGSRNDRVTHIDLDGEYRLKEWLSLSFGLGTSSRASSDNQFSFRQTRFFFGVSGKY